MFIRSTKTIGRRPRWHTAAATAMALVVIVAVAVPRAQAQQQQEPMRLSLFDALRIALEQNLDIAVVDYDRRIATENVVSAQGAFDPVFQVGIPGATAVVGSPSAGGFGQAAPAVGGIGYSSSEAPTTSQLAGADVSNSGNFTTQATINQVLDFGLNYQAGYNVGRSTTNSLFTNLNPAWNNSLGFAVGQPLLRGRGKEATAWQVLLAQRNEEVSEQAFRTQVNQILFNVVQAYWELVFAGRNLAVAENSLQLAAAQLERTQAQVEVGMLAPVEVTQAEVAVAQRRNELIVARNAIENAADVLRALLRAQNLPGGWDTDLVATEAPEVTPRQADIDEAIESALASRPEIATTRAQLAARRVETVKANNDLLPALDLVASLTFQGIGGNKIIREGFPLGDVIGEVPGGYADALEQLFGFEFASWRFGFNLSLPIGNNTAKGNYARATLVEDKARTELQRAEQQAVLEVRRAVRAVADAGELIATTRVTRELAQRQLEIEQDRFEVGMSTNFEVLTFQDDLARARVQELRSMVDYRLAEAALGRVTGTLVDTYGIRIP